MEDGATPEDRILTVPNVISVVRLCCVPIFLWLLFGLGNRAGAAVLLGVLGATDWVDGYIARHHDQVSRLGKILDPVADRVLLLVGISAILIDGSAPLWVGILALAREALVTVAVLVLAALGAARIDVTWFGKAGTFGLMFAFPLFLLGSSSWSGADAAWFLGWCCAIPGLILGYIALGQYVPLGLRALREGRAGRASTREPIPEVPA